MPAKLKVRTCPICKELWSLPQKIYHPYNDVCPKCREEQREAFKAETMGDLRNKIGLKGKHPSWLHSYVRVRARNAHKKELDKSHCEACSYSKHLEICHIKALSSWPDEALVTEVNARSNVRFLCPNHHWEFDNGHLKFE
jgi:hypothetical protein